MRPLATPVQTRAAMLSVVLASLASSTSAQVGDLRPPEVYEAWFLAPDTAEHEVAVEGVVRLFLRQRRCERWSDGLESCTERKPDLSGLSVAWTVNGHLGGAPGLGRIRTFQDRFNTGGAVSMGLDIDDVVYEAPDRVPSPNPVAIAAVIGNIDRKEQVQLVTHVKVIDQPGWRGSFRVRLTAIHDPEGGLPTRTVAENPVFWIRERSVFDPNNPVDLTVIESDLTFTVTGVVSEAYGDDGEGIVILETRPQGSFNYFHRFNDECEKALTVATGERAEVYRTTPLYIIVKLQADGTSLISSIPNVAFDVSGYRYVETCDLGWSEDYKDVFDGVVVAGEVVGAADAANKLSPGFAVHDRLVGRPSNGKSVIGETKVPVNMRFAGGDAAGEAQVSWSLSRK